MDDTPEKIVQRVLKINASTKSLVERLCDFKIYAISVLSFIGSVCATDKATLKAENHDLQCTTAIPSNLLGVGSICGLGPDFVGLFSICLAARYRVAACSTTLTQGLENIQTARGHNCTPVFALSPIWENEFLVPSMAESTADAFVIVVWIAMAPLMKFRSMKSRKLLLAYFLTNSINKTLLVLSPVAPQKSWDRSVVIELLTFCLT